MQLMLLVLRTLRSSQMAVFGLAGIFTLGFAAYTSIRYVSLLSFGGRGGGLGVPI